MVCLIPSCVHVPECRPVFRPPTTVRPSTSIPLYAIKFPSLPPQANPTSPPGSPNPKLLPPPTSFWSVWIEWIGYCKKKQKTHACFQPVSAIFLSGAGLLTCIPAALNSRFLCNVGPPGLRSRPLGPELHEGPPPLLRFAWTSVGVGALACGAARRALFARISHASSSCSLFFGAFYSIIFLHSRA